MDSAVLVQYRNIEHTDGLICLDSIYCTAHMHCVCVVRHKLFGRKQFTDYWNGGMTAAD